MAYSTQNWRLVDVLKNGPSAQYGIWFDINWEHPLLGARVVAPFLGRHYWECLEKGEITLELSHGGGSFRYFDYVFPLNPGSLSGCVLHGEYSSKTFPGGSRGMDYIISKQFYAPVFWKSTDEEINYRRFFTINGLVSVRVEEPAVFADTHCLILELVREGLVTGLRVDHIDGLYNPRQYLERLCGSSGGIYTIVEKILALAEELPADWPVEGSTGYDFLNCVNGLFCMSTNEAAFSGIYRGFANMQDTMGELFHRSKRLILDRHLAGDLDNLTHLLKRIAVQSSDVIDGRDYTTARLREALAEMLCAIPVYRTYIDDNGVKVEEVCNVKGD